MIPPPVQTVREGWLVVGRRGGKSLISALVAVYLACFSEYSKALAPGERATVMVIAADRKQARVVFRYISGLIEGVPMLAAMVNQQTKEFSLVRGCYFESGHNLFPCRNQVFDCVLEIG